MEDSLAVELTFERKQRTVPIGEIGPGPGYGAQCRPRDMWLPMSSSRYRSVGPWLSLSPVPDCIPDVSVLNSPAAAKEVAGFLVLGDARVELGRRCRI